MGEEPGRGMGEMGVGEEQGEEGEAAMEEQEGWGWEAMVAVMVMAAREVEALGGREAKVEATGAGTEEEAEVLRNKRADEEWGHVCAYYFKI